MNEDLVTVVLNLIRRLLNVSGSLDNEADVIFGVILKLIPEVM